MTLRVDVPGSAALALAHLVLDVNGTLTDRGLPIEGVGERLSRLARLLDVHLLSADTFGTLTSVAESFGARSTVVATGEEKRRFVDELGLERCAAVGNGANDAAMLEAVALGIAVIGPEGAAGSAARAADVVCTSIVDALELLLDGRALAATLRP